MRVYPWENTGRLPLSSASQETVPCNASKMAIMNVISIVILLLYLQVSLWVERAPRQPMVKSELQYLYQNHRSSANSLGVSTCNEQRLLIEMA